MQAEVSPASLIWSTQDAGHLLVQHALRLLDAPMPQGALPLAERLGVSDRHLRRLFEAQLGLSPLQYLQTRRLLTAKQLLTDTPCPSPRWRWPVALAACGASMPRLPSTTA